MENIYFPICLYCRNLVNLNGIFFDSKANLFMKYNCLCDSKNYHIIETELYYTLISLYFNLKDKMYKSYRQYYCYTTNRFATEKYNCLESGHFVLLHYIDNLHIYCDIHKNNLNTLYCMNCKKLLCTDNRHKIHANHQTVSIYDLYAETKKEYIKKINSNLESYVDHIIQKSKLRHKSLAFRKLLKFFDFFIKCFLNCSPHPIYGVIIMIKSLLEIKNVQETIFTVNKPLKYRKTVINGKRTEAPSSSRSENSFKLYILKNGKIIVANIGKGRTLSSFFSKTFCSLIYQNYSIDTILLYKDIDYPLCFMGGQSFIYMANWVSCPRFIYNYYNEAAGFNRYTKVEYGFFMDKDTFIFIADDNVKCLNIKTKKITKMKGDSNIHVYPPITKVSVLKVFKINDNNIGLVYRDRIEIWDAYNIKKLETANANINIFEGEFENGIHDCVVVNNKYLFSINHALDGDYIIYWKLDDLSIDSCTKSSVSIKRIVAEIENNKIICENDEYELLVFDKEARQVVTVLKNWKCKNGFHEIAISPDGIKYVIEDSNCITICL